VSQQFNDSPPDQILFVFIFICLVIIVFNFVSLSCFMLFIVLCFQFLIHHQTRYPSE